MVDACRETACVQASIVAENVLMEEVDRDALAPGIAVELPLTGAREAGVDEHDHVFALDALHDVGVQGFHGRLTRSCRCDLAGLEPSETSRGMMNATSL